MPHQDIIETKADLERAKKRIAELEDALDINAAGNEKAALLRAIELWESSPKQIRWPTD